MARFLILSPAGVPRTGDSLWSVVFACDAVRPDLQARRVAFRGSPDTVRIGEDFNPRELERELAARALVLLRRAGYVLYEQTDKT